MIELLIIFVLGTLFSGCCLWMGMKITNVDGTFPAMLGIAAVSSALGLVPLAGFILGTVAMFVLICTLTDANFWPDAILMVFVAKGIGFMTGLFLAAVLSGA